MTGIKLQRCIPRKTALQWHTSGRQLPASTRDDYPAVGPTQGWSEAPLCLEGDISKRQQCSASISTACEIKQETGILPSEKTKVPLMRHQHLTSCQAPAVLPFTYRTSPLGKRLPLAHLTLLTRCELRNICLHLVVQLGKLHWLYTPV